MRSVDEIKLRDEAAPIYDNWYLERGKNAVAAEDKAIINKLQLQDGIETFLDLGCGTGRLTAEIADLYPQMKCYGVDISPKSINILRNKNKKNIIALEADVSTKKLSELGIFNVDRILSMQMLQHLDREGAIHALNEIYESLTPNGIAVVELYNYGGIWRTAERIKARGKIRKIQRGGLFYEYRYSADEFAEFALKHTSFRSIELYGCQNILRRFINGFDCLIPFDLWLSKFGSSKFLGYYFIAVLRKH